MSFQYMPLYTGEYLRATRHLTPEEHGIYLLLLMHCWDLKEPVPLDERKQCGIVNARSGGEIESLRRVLREFFVRMDDGWYNKRIKKEIERFETISTSRSTAGAKGAKSRWQMPSTCHSLSLSLEPNPNPNPTPNTSREPKAPSGSKSRPTLDEL